MQTTNNRNLLLELSTQLTETLGVPVKVSRLNIENDQSCRGKSEVYTISVRRRKNGFTETGPFLEVMIRPNYTPFPWIDVCALTGEDKNRSLSRGTRIDTRFVETLAELIAQQLDAQGWDPAPGPTKAGPLLAEILRPL